MNITFTLNTGVQISADIPNFKSQEFASQLNDPQTLFISVGNNGFSKHNLLGWFEKPIETPSA